MFTSNAIYSINFSLFFVLLHQINREKQRDKEIEMAKKKKENIERIEDMTIRFFLTEKQGKTLVMLFERSQPILWR